ncbi:radical SAM protein [Tepidibacillus infernus]|uniref:radical SAM/SPASM domain-containing protein n=1 Tax=Tepidibacillus TaxID=1494427 RepID=UPI0008532463|nr:radical SAM protein [Tepidibacillus sp. HK-1]GBF11996.1 antilisterial bacteriocin subtilosin biosynthesis protein AlbA [Tepidibacillus sp. HK-1]
MQPRLIFWELTEGCNLKCVHCRATAQPNRNKEELSTEEAYQVIDQIASLGDPILILTGGEPLYRPDFYEIASYALQKGLKVALATNGTLIDQYHARKIKEIGIKRVSISIDGANKETHDGFRGIPGAFDQALEGAKFLQDAGVDVQFNTTISKHNVDQIEELLQLAVDKKAVALHLFMLVPVGCGIQIAENQMLPSEQYEEVLAWFSEQSREAPLEIKATCAPHYYRIIRQKAKERGEKVTFQTHGMAAMTKGCLAGTGVFFISHKGKVQPCGYLPVEAGDVKKQTLKEIWNESPVFLKLRDQESLEGKCSVCEYINVCSGCRARAFYETGNYMAEEPYCIYQPARD